MFSSDSINVGLSSGVCYIIIGVFWSLSLSVLSAESPDMLEILEWLALSCGERSVAAVAPVTAEMLCGGLHRFSSSIRSVSELYILVGSDLSMYPMTA